MTRPLGGTGVLVCFMCTCRWKNMIALLSAGHLRITLRARVRKEFDFAQSEGMSEKSILRGRMKISRVKQQQKMFEKFYSAGRAGSNMTCIFNWLWLTETGVRQCMSVLFCYQYWQHNTDNGRSGVPPGSTTPPAHRAIRLIHVRK